jgi:hypothetical protein
MAFLYGGFLVVLDLLLIWSFLDKDDTSILGIDLSG